MGNQYGAGTKIPYSVIGRRLHVLEGVTPDGIVTGEAFVPSAVSACRYLRLLHCSPPPLLPEVRAAISPTESVRDAAGSLLHKGRRGLESSRGHQLSCGRVSHGCGSHSHCRSSSTSSSPSLG